MLELSHGNPLACASGDLHDAFVVVSIADAETKARVFADAEAKYSLAISHHEEGDGASRNIPEGSGKSS